ncbi:MAG: hypothetical protein JXB32_20140, partial [Deltaproteobacteria bacterium]|nr:hypothetical protein [Deltaproteobacteria bacterium]
MSKHVGIGLLAVLSAAGLGGCVVHGRAAVRTAEPPPPTVVVAGEAQPQPPPPTIVGAPEPGTPAQPPPPTIVGAPE